MAPMKRVVGPSLLLLLALMAAPVGAEPRARDSAMAGSAVMAARQPEDSCGGRGILDAAVPNGVFLEACRFHDACYRSSALDQGKCDADFLRDMQQACDEEFPGVERVGLNTACRVKAYTYYRAVNSRVGAMLYPGATTGGQMSGVTPRLTGARNGAPNLDVCAEVTNTANRKMRYLLSLHDARGAWVANGPALGTVSLQAGETQTLCTGTAMSLFRKADNLGPAYSVILKADDPSTLNPLADLISLDRVDCETDTGRCRRVAP
ncbi:hypothetical protein [Hyphomonas sp.]|uniref:hypothetical protein n=1 Tax=Hyphomonas sp. TaxID=87 RepID=UPI00391AEAFB